ncbi:BTAD domain-containing putative transcriptional regulator [Kribbella sp. NPDC056345]|uniref:BTAD domain-containing putative transcriptional regulator n=1 Tax=Kribbella sp. NPDC056345 TaxID=3345789 RepID=UPI0035DB2168
MLLCRDLGPLVVELDGLTVDVGGRVPHRLLAALACADGAPVPDDLLAEQVWGDNLPAAVPNSLRVVVSRLRAALGPAGHRYIDRTPSGYALTAGRTDHAAFTELVEQALAQQVSGERISTLLAALDLWRGEPWPELAESVSAAGGRSRLIEWQQLAVEELAAARLAIGSTTEAVTLLTEAVAEAPFRERRWELLALGLYRSGRQAQALAELRRVRALLIDELGIEPGPALRELERRMLAHDAQLLLIEAPAAHGGSSRRAPVLPATALSRPSSPLIGRGTDLAVLSDLVARERLVTLVGPAGVGKTRLALEYAAQPGELDVRPVRLADIQVAETVATSVAAALGASRRSDEPVTAIRRALEGRPYLLLLDNCEHIVAGVAELALALLAVCPELRILATSREALEVDGEHVLPVGPLSVLDTDGSDGPAVRLLLDRATAARAGWVPTPADHDSARRICTSLDGLPLAIELAAARERAFGLPELADRLHDRVDVLGSTPRGSTSPHRSLAAAIQWSIEQLDDAERTFLLRLWPFEGGFDWQAAESVQGRPGPTLSTLAGLVGRSVITADRSSGSTRYRMLETIRRHCRELDPEPAATLEAHARWARTYVVGRDLELVGPRAAEVNRGLELERANLTAAITHDLTHAPVAALRTAAAMDWAWMNIGARAEGVRLVQAALDAAPDAPVADRAAGVLALGIGSLHAGDPRAAQQQIETCLDMLTGSAPATRLLQHKALANLGTAAIECGDTNLADRVIEHLRLAIADERTADWIHCVVLLLDAASHLLKGRIDDGIDLFLEANERCAECGYLWGSGTSAIFLALASLATERPTDAVRWAVAGARIFRDQVSNADQVLAMYAGALALAALVPADQSVRLYAAIRRHSDRLGIDPARYRLLGGSVAGLLDTVAADPQFAESVRQGQALSWPEACSLFNHTTLLAGIAGADL